MAVLIFSALPTRFISVILLTSMSFTVAISISIVSATVLRSIPRVINAVMSTLPQTFLLPHTRGSVWSFSILKPINPGLIIIIDHAISSAAQAEAFKLLLTAWATLTAFICKGRLQHEVHCFAECASFIHGCYAGLIQDAWSQVSYSAALCWIKRVRRAQTEQVSSLDSGAKLMRLFRFICELGLCMPFTSQNAHISLCSLSVLASKSWPLCVALYAVVNVLWMPDVLHLRALLRDRLPLRFYRQRPCGMMIPAGFYTDQAWDTTRIYHTNCGCWKEVTSQITFSDQNLGQHRVHGEIWAQSCLLHVAFLQVSDFQLPPSEQQNQLGQMPAKTTSKFWVSSLDNSHSLFMQAAFLFL